MSVGVKTRVSVRVRSFWEKGQTMPKKKTDNAIRLSYQAYAKLLVYSSINIWFVASFQR